MKDYIKKKLEDFYEKCGNIESKLDRYDDIYQKQWKRDKDDISKNLYQQITSTSDVIQYIDYFLGSVEREKSLSVLNLDIYDVELALYKAVYALKKMANQYDNNKCSFSIDEKQVDELFDKMEQAYTDMKAELLCRTSY